MFPRVLGTVTFLEPVAFCGSYSIAMEACDAPMVFQIRVVGERSP